MPLPWQCSRPGWMELWATWSSGRCPCSWQGCWNQMILKVPSNPYLSMNLWFYEIWCWKECKICLEAVSSFLLSISNQHFFYTFPSKILSWNLVWVEKRVYISVQALRWLFSWYMFFHTREYFFFLWTLDQKCTFPFMLTIPRLLRMLKSNSAYIITALWL